MSNPDVETPEVDDSVEGDVEEGKANADTSDDDLSEVDAALAEIGPEESDVSDNADDSDADVSAADGGDPLGQADSSTASSDGELSVEALVADLERVTGERDQYLEASQRLQAEFENYRKQVSRREADSKERANDGLINELLPVLDAFDGAVASGVDSVEPMRATMLDALTKSGLERLDPADAPFDPNQHEAVMHEDGGDGSGPIVAEVMRAGYIWKGRVLRPAMVKVVG